MKTRRVAVDPHNIDQGEILKAAQIIQRGGLVIFPTETVYGLAANTGDRTAVQALQRIKQRSDKKPFSILISHKEQADELTSILDPIIYKIMDAFWPGPLTVIVPAKNGGTVGLRMPDHSVALELAKYAGCPLAAPSANLEGQPAPLTCDQALSAFDGLVEMAIDSGPVRQGRSSTVVDLTKEDIEILREGPVSLSDIQREAGKRHVLFVCTGNSCRSVMAEYLLKESLAMAGRKDVEVSSAGTSGFLSGGPTQETLKVLEREGINASLHRSRCMNKIMLKKSDLILAMTSMHRYQIISFEPTVASRTYLLREFAKTCAGEFDLGIPDPIGQSAQTYEQCASIIKEATAKIMELL